MPSPTPAGSTTKLTSKGKDLENKSVKRLPETMASRITYQGMMKVKTRYQDEEVGQHDVTWSSCWVSHRLGYDQQPRHWGGHGQSSKKTWDQEPWHWGGHPGSTPSDQSQVVGVETQGSTPGYDLQPSCWGGDPRINPRITYNQVAGVETQGSTPGDPTTKLLGWKIQVRSSRDLTVNYLGWSPDLSLQRCSQVTRQGVAPSAKNPTRRLRTQTRTSAEVIDRLRGVARGPSDNCLPFVHGSWVPQQLHKESGISTDFLGTGSPTSNKEGTRRTSVGSQGEQAETYFQVSWYASSPPLIGTTSDKVHHRGLASQGGHRELKGCIPEPLNDKWDLQPNY